MGKRLYVGSLPFQTTESQLAAMFASCGTVVTTKIITDKLTGRSKGFGFVEMGSDAEADAAREKMNGFAIGDRKIVVNEARPMEERKSSPPPQGGQRRAPGGQGGRPGGQGGRPSGAPSGPNGNSFSNRPSSGYGQPPSSGWGQGAFRSGNGSGEYRDPFHAQRNGGGGFRDANKNNRSGYQGGFRDNGGFNARGDSNFGARRDMGRRKSWGSQDNRRQGPGQRQGGDNRTPLDDNFGNR